MALVLLATISVVCVALLFIERRDINLLMHNVTSLQEENAALRIQLENHHIGVATRENTAARLAD